mgnify:CR=1 FL=1
MINNKRNLQDVTFVIPLKLDSEDRKRNLRICVNFIERHFDTNIIVCENDKVSNKDYVKTVSSKIKYMFDEDKTGIFKYTKILNDMTKEATTPIIANYDVDCIFNPDAILSAVEAIRSKSFDVVFPYGGPFVDVKPSQFHHIENDTITDINVSECQVLHPQSCGGCIFFDKQKYYEAGLENEKQISWGFADNERMARINILEYRIGRVPGNCYHMSHSRDHNGWFSEHTKQNEIEFNKVASMKKEQLKEYIKTFEWLN